MSQLIRPRGLAALVVPAALWLATVGAGGFLLATASADRIVNGCRILDNPTREKHTDCPGHHLRGVDIRYLNLWYANLRGADLARANLNYVSARYANLRGADLSHASMYVVVLIRAELNGANLPYANLSRDTLTNADLRDADLSHANLREANLRNANLLGAFLRDAKFCKTIMPDGHTNNSDCPRRGRRPA